MLRVGACIGIGIAVLIGLAGSGDGHIGDSHIGAGHAPQSDTSLAQACAGQPTDHQLESALFEARAQSIGGFDAICYAVEEPLAPRTGPALSSNVNVDIDGAEGLDPKRGRQRRR
jgi:hypothetical protein